jgi:hypothetical protein
MFRPRAGVRARLSRCFTAPPQALIPITVSEPSSVVPTPSPLDGVSSEVLSGMRAALDRNGTRPPHQDGEVHQAVRRLVNEARASGIPVEQLIIYLKGQCAALGVSGHGRARETRDAMVERLVSLCLDEYFVGQ